MKQWYYDRLLGKLTTATTKAHKLDAHKITVRHGSRTVCELEYWELLDLLKLWEEDARKKWPIVPDEEPEGGNQ